MKSKLIYWLLMIFVAACGGRSGAGNAAQQNYETVEEGSASGVTSTLHGPGETLPPITGTNADTTTDFALNPNALPPLQPQPIAGGTYPQPQALPPMTSASASPAPQPSVPAPPQTQQARPAPQPEPERAEPTPAEPTPASPTDTTATPPPPAEKPKNEEPPPPADDASGEQAEEPPPPPPPN